MRSPLKPKWTALASGLWSGESDALDWRRLGEAALERDVLGTLDLKLIRLLAMRAGRPGDAALLAVLGCLLAAVRTGGLRIPAAPEALAGRMEGFLRSLHAGPAATPRDLAEAAAALALRFDEGVRTGAYAGILGGPEEFKPLLHSGRSLYFQKYHAAEALVGSRLADLLSAPDRPLEASDESNILDTVFHRFPLRAGGPGSPPLESGPAEAAALGLGLRKRLVVVSGGPGTGKTSLVANLLRAAIRLPGTASAPRETRSGAEGAPAPGLRIRLAAPTGRAAQRMTESLRAGLASIAYDPAGPGPAAPGPATGTAPTAEPAAPAVPAPAVAAAGAQAERDLDAGLALLEGETLHRLLRYQPSRGEYFHRKGRPIPADLVVVDEASMIDIFALARLLDALEDGAGLVLLGDMDQLPSVEAGAVLADLMPGPGGTGRGPLAGHLVLLERSHRSGAGILEVAREINAQRGEAAIAAMSPPARPEDPPPWPVAFLEGGRKVVPGGGCRFILPPRDPDARRPGTSPALTAAGWETGQPDPEPAAYGRGLPALLASWSAFHFLGNPQAAASHPGRTLAAPRRAAYDELIFRLSETAPDPETLLSADGAGSPASDWLDDLREAFACLDQGRILAFTRKGWYGSLAVNRHLRDRLAPAWDPSGGPSGSEGFNGAPVQILENAYAQDLFNGEVGLMLRIRGRHLAFFRKEEGFRPYPAPFLPRHELAFATTVHKSQGSEYDQVLILLPEPGNRLLFKETLYTAITRARNFAGVYGPRGTFLEAVGRKAQRESGLREYLGNKPLPHPRGDG